MFVLYIVFNLIIFSSSSVGFLLWRPPVHPQEQQPFTGMTQSTSYYSEKSTKAWFQMKLNDSTKPAAEKLQHQPQQPQY
ncbi:transmembrane protein, putative (macronuclear) [Tetrahymena thermophila SB210]|uniref:Transmembrane protein, putative n=1 Tax=Tetrahymena thermophila (strain SB210) TaxID=312017 RepID=Q23H02_TETTS|nr:transmembrane protein, putative [Tetrahymena thermophila SB210]EAR95845.2 transmembrane protein, putative [Tetrahymena thermophila SB210]|eukprot:XP_001016090.2 transmembrane protein, putative [Tetrahymena thermophila SB210]